MTKKHFIALADAIKEHNGRVAESTENGYEIAFSFDQIQSLANFCKWQNERFDRSRWLGYIAGKNGKNGGVVKAS